ncbi:MAG TPA: bifunctional diaminohydroxyphosphoribosylaminopyrimidine deaminase/5-amino-6-(5-phosphoribosylamino)uracil reductase RibD [Armatimonadetes bacterium]|nr:bifunctional diaminohydroxyphosphoribosylaminopyrimidine deaminase/5-amino-6-(5-phosphoribosylamino)uracil reductase RibD [Armatimonadota bacterium]
MSHLSEDTYWMRRALKLARRAKGQTSPNPCVGAVIVKDGQLVAEAYHHGAGMPHAEALALQQAGERARSATLYVTLEPCCHYGRTPPCTDAIIRARIKRVVIPFTDPNPLVRGRSVQILRDAGIEVTMGVLEEDAQQLIEDFTKFITTHTPFVTLKLATSLDGKIATRTGDSKWITSERAQRIAHRLRREHTAVMVGINTVLIDDPELTARYGRVERQPTRIVVDSTARLPINSRLCQTAERAPIWLATTRRAPLQCKQRLQRAGVRVLTVKARDGKVDLKALMRRLAREEIMSVLIEGGGEIAWSALDAGIVDKVVWFIAPIIIGGRKAHHSVAGEGIAYLRDAFQLERVSIKRIGSDIMLVGYVKCKR